MTPSTNIDTLTILRTGEKQTTNKQNIIKNNKLDFLIVESSLKC